MSRRFKQVGVALGGGGARGWAHIGVLNALRDLNVEVDWIAGTSMGALVGGVYASGQLQRLETLALGLDWRHVLYYFLEFSLPRSGLVDGQRVIEMLEDHVSTLTIEELPVPFAAVAADVRTGEEIQIDKGNLVEAIRASIAIPGMFTPVVRDNHVLSDGGLVNPLPVSAVRRLGAKRVIAVDITVGEPPMKPRVSKEAADDAAPDDASGWWEERIDHLKRHFDISRLPAARQWFGAGDVPNIFDMIGHSIRVQQQQITRARLQHEPADVLIQPDVADLTFMDFNRAREAIDAGYAATREALG